MQQDDKPEPKSPAGKAWSGRFAEPVDALTQRFNASVAFDRRLAEFDIQASLAHARMLARRAIISNADLADIERGMGLVLVEVTSGRFEWSIEREDVHSNIEQRLTELVGEAGKRLHTARSRNDQGATAGRLWVRTEIDTQGALLPRVRAAPPHLPCPHPPTALPRFTHLPIPHALT